jgi:hypothetical protein
MSNEIDRTLTATCSGCGAAFVRCPDCDGKDPALAEARAEAARERHRAEVAEAERDLARAGHDADRLQARVREMSRENNVPSAEGCKALDECRAAWGRHKKAADKLRALTVGEGRR